MKRYTVILLSVAATAAAMSLSWSNEEDRQQSLSRYCENVRLWQQDTARHIDPTRRGGHPNYRQRVCQP